MSLFKLTEVRPDSLPLLQHPEKPLSSSQHPPAPSSMLIMANFCLVSSFSRTQPPLLRPCLTLPPPCLYTPIHTKPLHAPPHPHTTLNPTFFILSNSHTHSGPSYGPRSTLPSQCKHMHFHAETRCLDFRPTVSHEQHEASSLTFLLSVFQRILLFYV